VARINVIIPSSATGAATGLSIPRPWSVPPCRSGPDPVRIPKLYLRNPDFARFRALGGAQFPMLSSRCSPAGTASPSANAEGTRAGTGRGRRRECSLVVVLLSRETGSSHCDYAVCLESRVSSVKWFAVSRTSSRGVSADVESTRRRTGTTLKHSLYLITTALLDDLRGTRSQTKQRKKKKHTGNGVKLDLRLDERRRAKNSL
jgi:hypothetical protein